MSNFEILIQIVQFIINPGVKPGYGGSPHFNFVFFFVYLISVLFILIIGKGIPSNLCHLILCIVICSNDRLGRLEKQQDRGLLWQP